MLILDNKINHLIIKKMKYIGLLMINKKFQFALIEILL